MPRLAAEVVTTTDVELSPKLKKQLRLVIERFRLRRAEIKALGALQDSAKAEIQLLFADNDQFEALENGVRVDDIPLKMVGGTSKSLNKKKLMKKFGLTPGDLESVTDEKKKKAYLGIYLPDDKDEEDDE